MEELLPVWARSSRLRPGTHDARSGVARPPCTKHATVDPTEGEAVAIMKTLGIAVGALACAAAMPAFAQSSPLPSTTSPPGMAAEARDVLTAPVPAPVNAYEFGVEAGYMQGFGSVITDPRVGAGPGGTIGASFGYRPVPRWSVGVGGQYQGFSGGANGASVRGMTADVRGAYHFSPYRRVDPYLSFGAGYRLVAESPAGNAPTSLWHGLELGKVQVGVDVRPSENVAVAPVIGVDVDVFPWRPAFGAEGVAPRGFSTFVFAGVQGRFDVGGTRQNNPAP